VDSFHDSIDGGLAYFVNFAVIVEISSGRVALSSVLVESPWMVTCQCELLWSSSSSVMISSSEHNLVHTIHGCNENILKR
jgi:hypothetical protein